MKKTGSPSRWFNLAERWGVRPDGSNPGQRVERYPTMNGTKPAEVVKIDR